MPRIHLVVSEPDRTRAAAAHRLDGRAGSEPFRTEDDVWEFFADRDAETACGIEPDWEQHLDVILASREAAGDSLG